MSDTIISRWHPQDRTRTHTTTEYKVENFLALDFLDFLDFLVFIFSSFDWKSSAHLLFTTDRLTDCIYFHFYFHTNLLQQTNHHLSSIMNMNCHQPGNPAPHNPLDVFPHHLLPRLHRCIFMYLILVTWSLPYWQAYCSGNVVTFQGRLRLRFFFRKRTTNYKKCSCFLKS